MATGRVASARLRAVYRDIHKDPRWDHLRAPGIRLVPGRGQETNPLAMLVGEAPGATENTHARPFCGPSGRILNQLMDLAGLHADPHEYGDAEWSDIAAPNAFITNVVKYRPPGNRTPTVAEILDGTESLRAEWRAIGSPKLLVAIGTTARSALANPALRMGAGQWCTLSGGVFLWVHYHPAYGLRQPSARPIMERHWEEMGKWIRETLG